MIVKLQIPYNTVTTQIPTYPLPNATGVMAACPLCNGRIIITNTTEETDVCVLDTCCECRVEAAIMDQIIVPDRRRRRREYLTGRAEALAKAALRCSVVITALTGTLASFIASYRIQVDLGTYVPFSNQSVIVLGYAITNAAGREQAANIEGLLTILGWLGVVGTFLVLKWTSVATLAHKPLPYVPPVSVANLPTKETLVRASEEPAVAQSAVLLRAAKGEETAEEELLRVEAM